MDQKPSLNQFARVVQNALKGNRSRGLRAYANKTSNAVTAFRMTYTFY